MQRNGRNKRGNFVTFRTISLQCNGNASGVVDIQFLQDACLHFGYHKSCYQKFANKVYIEKPQKASEKASAKATLKLTTEESESQSDDEYDVSSPKKHRSSAVPKVGETSCSVLPALCIICKNKELKTS